MDRFVNRRSSSSVDLDASSRDDVRAERAAIALSVGLNWPPDRYTKTPRGRPNRQQLWERALQEHILEHHELPRGISLQRPAWWRPGEAIDRPLTHEELTQIKTPCAALAAVPVEDEPSGPAREALAGAHSSRHVRERLGHDDHDLAARGRCGHHSEPQQRRTIVDPPVGHGQHPRQRGHIGSHAGHIPSRRARLPPTTKHVVSATLRRGRLPQLHELHSDAGERHSCPRRSRWLLRWPGHEQTMAAPVIGRMGIARSRGHLGREQGLEHGMAPTARPRRRFPRCRRRGHGAPLPRRSIREAHRAGAPLQKTQWTGPWQRRRTTMTTRPCQTRRRLSRSRS